MLLQKTERTYQLYSLQSFLQFLLSLPLFQYALQSPDQLCSKPFWLHVYILWNPVWALEKEMSKCKHCCITVKATSAVPGCFPTLASNILSAITLKCLNISRKTLNQMVLSVKNTKGIINLSISKCATTLPLNITKADGLFFSMLHSLL